MEECNDNISMGLTMNSGVTRILVINGQDAASLNATNDVKAWYIDD